MMDDATQWMLNPERPVESLEEKAARLEGERDQYASAIRHLLQTVRHTAYAWSTTLPETIRTADAVKALSGIASHVPVREHLRDDLWQRIAGAYYVRFENDGHPEDSKAAADEAMTIVQPELDALVAERDRLSAVATQERDLKEGQRILWAADIERAKAAEARIQAITEATVTWRDRPGGDVGLAIALAGILDTEQPEPPASAALVRVLRECDRIEREVYGQHDEDDDGMREAVRRIRAAATEPLTRAALDSAKEAK